ncbi:hypothetical protein PO909_001967 [Leuciscus waleckii]
MGWSDRVGGVASRWWLSIVMSVNPTSTPTVTAGSSFLPAPPQSSGTLAPHQTLVATTPPPPALLLKSIVSPSVLWDPSARPPSAITRISSATLAPPSLDSTVGCRHRVLGPLHRPFSIIAPGSRRVAVIIPSPSPVTIPSPSPVTIPSSAS